MLFILTLNDVPPPTDSAKEDGRDRLSREEKREASALCIYSIKMIGRGPCDPPTRPSSSKCAYWVQFRHRKGQPLSITSEFPCTILELKKNVFLRCKLNPKESLLRLYDVGDKTCSEPLSDDAFPNNGTSFIIVRTPAPKYIHAKATGKRLFRLEDLDDMDVRTTPPKHYKCNKCGGDNHFNAHCNPTILC